MQTNIYYKNIYKLFDTLFIYKIIHVTEVQCSYKIQNSYFWYVKNVFNKSKCLHILLGSWGNIETYESERNSSESHAETRNEEEKWEEEKMEKW